MAGTKEIQRRIKSIKNTRKITRAMEMVAAAKMKKQIDAVLAIRAYAQTAWQMLTNLSRAFEKGQHGLLEHRPVRKILVILITSNRGLCGGYNSHVLKKLLDQVKNPKYIKVNKLGEQRLESPVSDEDLEFDFIGVGKKGAQYLISHGYNLVAEFENLNFSPTPGLVSPLAQMVMDDYEAEKYDKVVLAYTDFKNTLIQLPKLRQLLPISRTDLEKQIEEMGGEVTDFEAGKEGDAKRADANPWLEQQAGTEAEGLIDYKFEPRPGRVLNKLLPRLVEMQIYHAILESNASRESARMMAMKNATEAASDIMAELEYSYNQIRQMNITQEIAEITSGRVALE